MVRSTILPGTTEDRLIPRLEDSSGLTVGNELQMVFHPEFLREGSGIADFDDPPKIVVGEPQTGAGDVLVDLYSNSDAPLYRLTTAEAELVKYVDNLFHAVKITFANEVGAMAQAIGLDGRTILDLLVADTKLNISPAYLRPGFAYGGSCLPKDTRAFLRLAELRSVRLPMLEGLPQSNIQQVERLITRVLRHQPVRVGMVGLAFKAGTDDMRESPYVEVAKRLTGEGIEVKIYDPSVHPENLIGSNRLAVQASLRHLEELLVRSLADLERCDVILVNHAAVNADRVRRWLETGIRIFDLVGILDVGDEEGYEGVAW